jgi:hypothetical protein
MVVHPDWPGRASRYLKAELKRQGVTYEELANRLNADGFEETKASVANKISRGAFTAAFFLASMQAIGTQIIRVEDI